jgi:hypothetical protein
LPVLCPCLIPTHGGSCPSHRVKAQSVHLWLHSRLPHIDGRTPCLILKPASTSISSIKAGDTQAWTLRPFRNSWAFLVPLCSPPLRPRASEFVAATSRPWSQVRRFFSQFGCTFCSSERDGRLPLMCLSALPPRMPTNTHLRPIFPRSTRRNRDHWSFKYFKGQTILARFFDRAGTQDTRRTCCRYQTACLFRCQGVKGGRESAPGLQSRRVAVMESTEFDYVREIL